MLEQREMLSISPSEVKEPVALVSGRIDQLWLSGNVYSDSNDSGSHDDTETGLAGWTVYLDDNGNGQRDEEEFRAVTDLTGNYQFIITSYFFSDWPAPSTVKVGVESQPHWAMPPTQEVLALPFNPTPGVDFGLHSDVSRIPSVPVGPEFRVNTYTLFNQSLAAIATDSTGNLVVAWSSDGQDGSGSGVYAQRYDSAGVPLGGEFRVNTYTTGMQSSPAIATDSTGNFLITWSSSGQDGSGSGVYAQRYDAAGVPLGGEFRVNSYTSGSQSSPAIAIDSTGNFVIAWSSSGQDGSFDGVYAQRYDATGLSLGSEFRVNTYTIDQQSSPAIAIDAVGNFVITWRSSRQDGTDDNDNGSGVYAQRYDAAGSPLGGEFRVNSYSIDLQSSPAIAMNAAGNFIIVWHSFGQDGNRYGVYAQRYDAAGAPLGGEFRVNTYATSDQANPAIAMDSTGNFAITWESFGQDGSDYGVYAQRYDAAGAPLGGEFRVNTFTTGDQAGPAIAMEAAGNFTVAWHGFSEDGSGAGIYAQRYALVGPPRLSVDDVQLVEGTGQVTEAVVTVRLSKESDQRVDVWYSTMSGTATDSEDYSAIPLTKLTFGPGEIRKTISVHIVSDGMDEPDEQFYIDFTNIQGAVIGNGRSVITIHDDDRAITVEGDEFVQPVFAPRGTSFVVTLPSASSLPITVDYATLDGTALAGIHYLTTNGSLIFLPGERTKTVPITVLPGREDPSGRTILLRLSNSQNGQIAIPEAAITLHGRPDLFVSQMSAPPAAITGETIQYTWTVTNLGNAPATGTWVDRVYLSDDNQVGGDTTIGTFPFSGSIQIGETIERRQEYKLSDALEGNRWLVVTTEANNQIAEQPNELPNTRIADAPIAVQLRPFPNLVVDSIEAGEVGTFTAGERLDVRWTVKNTGNGATNAAFWYDGVWLSTEQTRNSFSYFLGEVPNGSYLTPPGGYSPGYSSGLSWNIPENLFGDFYVIVETDWRKQVDENEAEGNNENHTGVIPIRLPDPPDLQVSDVVVQPQSAFSGNYVDITWTVENHGTATRAGGWVDEIYLVTDNSTVRLAQVTHTGDLTAAGSNDATRSYTITRPVQIPHEIARTASTLTVSILVRTDATNRVPEQAFEGNNENSAELLVIRGPQADLEVASVQASDPNRAGELLDVTYAVINAGAAPTRIGSWTDAFYLSSTETLDPETAILLGRRTFTAPGGRLPAYDPNQPAAPFERSVTLPIPLGLSGRFYVFVVADETDRVFEENETNVGQTHQSIEVFSSTADLVVSASAPGTAIAGAAILVDWTVLNSGDGDTIQSTWTDRVYLSSSPNFDPATARALGSYTHTNLLNGKPASLPPSRSSTKTNLVTIPFDVTGPVYLFVVANASSEVFEGTSHASNISAAIPLAIVRDTPDLQVTNVTVDPSAESSGALKITWTVVNAGGGKTNATVWSDDVYLSTDEQINDGDYYLGRVIHSGVLEPDGTYTASRTFTLPVDFTGTYFAIVRTDGGNVVLEGADEENNDGHSMGGTTITFNAVPNLAVESVDAPLTAISGQPFELTWTVRNDGAATGMRSWDDYVYLSLDPILDPATDRYLGFVKQTRDLGAAGSYTVTKSFNIPLGLSGPFYIFVRTDGGNAIYEREGEGNNNTLYDPVPMQVNLLPPANLVVGTIVIPADSQPGQLASVDYTVTNLGPGVALGRWVDSVYLSSDDQWDVGDTLLGRFNQTANSPGIGVGASYLGSINAPLPVVLPGMYHVIVRTDIRNAIPESNEEDNLAASLDRFEISIPELSPGIPLDGLIRYGEQLYYRIEVPVEREGEALVINFRTDRATASNELYARFGSIASRTQYDFRSSAAFNNEQQVVIPAAKAGTYYVLAIADPMQATLGNQGPLGEFHINANYVQFTVFNESFGQGGTAGNRTIEIDGVKFDRIVTAKLVNGSGVELPAIQYYRISETKLFATFDLTQAEPGTYDVVFEKPTTGEVVWKQHSFEVVPAVPSELVTSVSAPEALGWPPHDPPRLFEFSVSWGNGGLNDLATPFLEVSSTAFFTPNRADTITELNKHLDKGRVTILNGSLESFFGVVDSGFPPGILLPGQSASRTFYALNDPSRDPVRIWVDSLGQENADYAPDWTSIVEMYAPADLPSDRIQSAADYMAGHFGPTIRNLHVQLASYAVLFNYDELLDDAYSRTLTAAVNEAVAASGSSVRGLLSANSVDLAPGNRLVLAHSRGDQQVYSATTLEDGSFVLPQLPAGTYDLSVSGGLLNGERSVSITLDEGESFINDWELTSGASISARALWADGTAISTTPVMLERIDSLAGSTSTFLASILTSDTGEILFTNLPAGEYRLLIELPGQVRHLQSYLTVMASQELELGDLRAEPTGIISGHISDASTGEPIHGAWLFIHAANGDSLSIQTDANGDYLLSTVPRGIVEISLWAAGYIVPETKRVTISDTPAVLDQSLVNTVIVSGTITDHSGTPIAGAKVFFNDGVPYTSALTDDAGHYQIAGVTPGTAELWAQAAHFMPTSFVIVLTPGQRDHVANFALEAGMKVTGRVTVDTHFIAGAHVVLRANSGAHSMATTNSLGEFEISDLGPGIYYVTATAVGYTTWSQMLTIPTEADRVDLSIAMTVGAGLTGRITGSDGVTPVGNATIELRSVDGTRVRTVVSERDGSYSANDIEDGVYHIHVTSELHSFVDIDMTLIAGQVSVVNFLASERRVDGQIRRLQDSFGVADATVTLLEINDHGLSIVLRTITNSVGGFAFESVRAGKYVLIVDAAGFGRHLVPVVVNDNDDSGRSLTIDLSTSVRLSGTVRDATDTPLPGAMLLIRRVGTKGDPGQVTFAGVEGDYSFDSIVPDDYVVTAVAGDLVASSRVGKQTSDVTVDFELVPSGSQLSGRVVDAVTGLPVAGALIVITSGGIPYLLRSGNDGTFLLTLPDGVLTLVASYDDQQWTTTIELNEDRDVTVALSLSDSSAQGHAGRALRPLGDEDPGRSLRPSGDAPHPQDAPPVPISPVARPRFEVAWLIGQVAASLPQDIDKAVNLPVPSLPELEDIIPFANPRFPVALEQNTPLNEQYLGLVNRLKDINRYYGDEANTLKSLATDVKMAQEKLRRSWNTTGVEQYKAVLKRIDEIYRDIGAAILVLMPIAGADIIPILPPILWHQLDKYKKEFVELDNKLKALVGEYGTNAKDITSKTTEFNRAYESLEAKLDRYTEAALDFNAKLDRFEKSLVVANTDRPDPVKTGEKLEDFVLRNDKWPRADVDLSQVRVEFVSPPAGLVSDEFGQFSFVSNEAGVYKIKYNLTVKGITKNASLIIQVRPRTVPPDPGGGEDPPADPSSLPRNPPHKIPKVGNLDPNDIVGPPGIGDERFVSSEAPLNYTIRFENDAVQATAPVQRLEITQTLDSDLDYRTFRLGGLGVGPFTIDSANGLPAYQGRLDYRAQFGIFIDVLAGVRVLNNGQAEAFWFLTAIDPQTGDVPVSPLAGFLPPNVDGVEGQGFVTYAIRPKSGVHTGAVIDAQARIVFDINPPLDTPPIFNTIDAVAPSSRVEVLEAVQGEARFDVRWSGEDDPNGSGLASYDVYVAANNGAFVKWLDATTLTQAVYEGMPGNTYRFFTIARDFVSNTERAPASADATTQIAGSEPVRVIAMHGIPDAWTNAPLEFVDVEFSLPIVDASFDGTDVTLTRNGVGVSTNGLSIESLSPNTYRVSGLANLTAGEGIYVLTIHASGVSAGGRIGSGALAASWKLDRTLPTSAVQGLARRQAMLEFEIAVAGFDPLGSSGTPASGIESYDIYVSTDGSPFVLWQTVPADSPSARFAGESSHTYAFRSLARDAAGNVEVQTVPIEASTYVPDLSSPTTQVTSVDASSSSLVLHWSGIDTGGSQVRYVDLYVSVDSGAPQRIQRMATSGPGNNGIYSGSATFQAIADGTEHHYRFYSIGIDRLGNIEEPPTDPALDVLLSTSFAPPFGLELVSFDVQAGATQRSYIRTLDAGFNQSDSLQHIVDSVNDEMTTNDRIRLTKFALDGSGPGSTVSLAELVRAIDHTISVDFGPDGLGGNRNTNSGDGFYRLEFDLDDDGIFETMQPFYRLLGDIDGNGGVTTGDTNAITSSLGIVGIGLNEDVNGDNVVNALDRTLATRALGRTLQQNIVAQLLDHVLAEVAATPIAIPPMVLRGIESASGGTPLDVKPEEPSDSAKVEITQSQHRQKSFSVIAPTVTLPFSSYGTPKEAVGGRRVSNRRPEKLSQECAPETPRMSNHPPIGGIRKSIGHNPND